MDVNVADLGDETLLAGVHAVVVAARTWQRPWDRPPNLADSVLEWRHEDAAEPLTMWVARDDGAVVGVGLLWLPRDDNTSMGFVEIWVHPGHRRRGAGRALLVAVSEHARRHGREQLIAEPFVPADGADHPSRAFARACGFQETATDVVRHLALPVPASLLDELDERARPHWQGRYRLATHVGGVPEADQGTLCVLMNRLGVDAPTGTVQFEPESLTPARYRDHLDLERAQGRSRLTTLAHDERTGDVVAYSDLMVPAGAPEVVWQWGTLVHGEHRGHRLGMAVKVANLRRLQADHPDRVRVTTSNDGTNRWMIDINARLGFRVVELSPRYRRVLSAPV